MPINFYNKLNSGLEITLNKDSIVVSCEDDAHIPKHRFILTPIDEAKKKPNNTKIDIIGIVVYVQETTIVKQKDGIEVWRHTIKLVDTSCSTIDVTLLGAHTESEGEDLQQKYYFQETTLLSIRGGCVFEFHGKVIST